MRAIAVVSLALGAGCGLRTGIADSLPSPTVDPAEVPADGAAEADAPTPGYPVCALGQVLCEGCTGAVACVDTGACPPAAECPPPSH